MVWERKHIEFIYFDEIDYKPLEAKGLPPGLELKILSIDESDGALSGLLRIPPGWQADLDFTFTTPEHLFILQGDLTINGKTLTEQFYSYHPKGASHGNMYSQNGCEAIVMWDAKFSVNINEKGSDEGIIVKDTINMNWEPTIAEGPQAGIMVKMLRFVPDTGEMTFLVGILPNWKETRQRHHACVEESFKIFGDMNLNTNLGDKLLMGERSYFYRPPWIKHGPLYTRKGTMSLVRTSSWLENRYMPLEEDEEYLKFLKEKSPNN
ncbi:MAG: DUF4437 domain-containing protein [Pyrinomonadaceae bacterium]|nr:DUF4437 domain-containing protein [Pyrinomonadaceae bacterium]MCX7640757.1 DUF4437 domain-containing protein [Pyrinomonadaceae bacterium]MDW8304652.1 DUF4437 domain-containing protein [Acidobacteriota bacterium]